MHRQCIARVDINRIAARLLASNTWLSLLYSPHSQCHTLLQIIIDAKFRRRNFWALLLHCTDVVILPPESQRRHKIHRVYHVVIKTGRFIWDDFATQLWICATLSNVVDFPLFGNSLFAHYFSWSLNLSFRWLFILSPHFSDSFCSLIVVIVFFCFNSSAMFKRE